MFRNAEFSLGSALKKPPEDFSLDDVNLSLGFKSTKDGVLLQNSNNVHPFHNYTLYGQMHLTRTKLWPVA